MRYHWNSCWCFLVVINKLNAYNAKYVYTVLLHFLPYCFFLACVANFYYSRYIRINFSARFLSLQFLCAGMAYSVEHWIIVLAWTGELLYGLLKGSTDINPADTFKQFFPLCQCECCFPADMGKLQSKFRKRSDLYRWEYSSDSLYIPRKNKSLNLVVQTKICRLVLTANLQNDKR